MTVRNLTVKPQYEIYRINRTVSTEFNLKVNCTQVIIIIKQRMIT